MIALGQRDVAHGLHLAEWLRGFHLLESLGQFGLAGMLKQIEQHLLLSEHGEKFVEQEWIEFVSGKGGRKNGTLDARPLLGADEKDQAVQQVADLQYPGQGRKARNGIENGFVDVGVKSHSRSSVDLLAVDLAAHFGDAGEIDVIRYSPRNLVMGRG